MNPSQSNWFDHLARVMGTGVLMLSQDLQVDYLSPKATSLLTGTDGDDDDDADRLQQELVEKVRGLIHDRDEDCDPGQTLSTRIELRPEGRRVVLEIEVHPIDEEACKGYMVILRDEAVRRLLELDLRLASQSRSTARLYRHLAHDLREPIGVIDLYLELLLNLLPETADAFSEQHRRQRDHITIIRQQVRNLDGNLQTLVAEIAHRDDAPESFDLNHLMTDMLRLIGLQIRGQNIALHTQLTERPAVVHGPRAALKQALLNIAINGIEAVHRGGRLTVALNVRQEDDAAVIEIGDDGPGIPAHVENRIYDMHFSTKPSGTGAGLPVAVHAIRKFNGRIEHHNREQGVTFTITLPLCHGKPAADAGAS